MKFSKALIASAVLSLSQANADLSEHSYYPAGLQEKVDSKELVDQALREELYKVLSYGHIPKANLHDTLIENCSQTETSCYSQVRGISYKQARKIMFGKLHLKKTSSGEYQVKDLYCNKNYGRSVGVGPNRIPDHTKINCEHTWPQSRFNKRESKNLQQTDLHHLYPVNSRANSSRGNIIFAEVNGLPVSSACEASTRGTAIGTNVAAFEPPNEHKGNVARAIFYFATRYRTTISDIEESYLRKWHELDPVDQEEMTRNERIYDVQRNRNPFIDHPDLVSSIKDF